MLFFSYHRSCHLFWLLCDDLNIVHVSFLYQELALYEDEARVNQQVVTIIFPSRKTPVVELVFCVIELTCVCIYNCWTLHVLIVNFSVAACIFDIVDKHSSKSQFLRLCCSYVSHHLHIVSERCHFFGCKQIQANIADTFKRQLEAVARRRTSAKATAAAIVRKAHGNFRSVQSRQRGRGRGRRGGRRSRWVFHCDQWLQFFKVLKEIGN